MPVIYTRNNIYKMLLSEFEGISERYISEMFNRLSDNDICERFLLLPLSKGRFYRI